jgi:hypothetical protein
MHGEWVEGPGASGADISRKLGVAVEPVAGETNQYVIKASRGSIDLSQIGAVHQDLGYSVGVTLANGKQVGFRFAGEYSGSRIPDPVELGRVLAARVTAIQRECRQYLVHAPKGSVDFARLGLVHLMEAHSVGVTLQDGIQIGFRYVGPSGESLSRALGARVEAIQEEPGQYYLYAQAGTVDLSRIGRINADLGYAVAVVLEDGERIGFRYTDAGQFSRAINANVRPLGEGQYLIDGSRGSADFSKIGTVHLDLGYTVGVTLGDGKKIGFRYAADQPTNPPTTDPCRR